MMASKSSKPAVPPALNDFVSRLHRLERKVHLLHHKVDTLHGEIDIVHNKARLIRAREHRRRQLT